jgi:capsular exopolysaccharide synthesis family protein
MMENNSNRNATPNSEIIDLREILFKYLRKWYWFVISVVVCFCVAYLYLKATNEQYEVQSTILLRKDANSGGLLDMSMLEGFGMSGSSKEVEDEIQVLSSKSIMTNVINTLGIETEYYLKSGLRYVELYPTTPIRLIVPDSFNDTVKQAVELKLKRTKKGYQVKLKIGKQKESYQIPDLNTTFDTPVGVLKFQQISQIKVGESFKVVTYPIRQLTEMYCSSVSVSAVNKKSNAIKVSTVSPSIKKSETIINKLIELYNLDAVIDKNMIASNTAVFVDERLKLIGKELLDVEMNAESYKRDKGLTDISSEAQIFLKSASEYDAKIAEIETQLKLVTYIETHVKDSKNQYSLVPANLGIQDKSLLEFLQEYNKALLERMKIMRTTNDQNPVITQMEQQLKELRTNIILSIASIKDGFKIAKKDLMGKDAQFASKIKDVPTQEREYIEIKRQQEIKSKLYLFLLQKREENELSLASTAPSAKTVDSAYVSLSPVAPKRMIVLLMSLIIGIAIPMIVIYVLDMFNNKINDRKEFKRLINVPFLGSIGFNKESEVVIVREGSTTPIVEMFRIIRTNMQFMLAGKENPVILVTSSISGEGKSFIAINMAMSLALMKKKVILVGLDIRSPMLGEYMHLSKDRGVTMFISDDSYKVNDVIVSSNLHPFLDVIPAGPVPPNPAELIMSKRLDELFAELKNRYDYIVVDSAPVGLVSDTYLLNRFVDNCLYVARQNYSPRDVSGLINEIYDNKKLNNVAAILNGTDESSEYGYGYGYGKRHNQSMAEKLSMTRKFRNK